MPLNPTLYALLNDRVAGGVLRVKNSGEKAIYDEYYDPVNGTQHLVLPLVYSGEEYILDCPICGDSRGRLYVNHMFGANLPGLGRDSDKLINCFNENCFSNYETRNNFADSLFDYTTGPDRTRMSSFTKGTGPDKAPEAVPTVELPGEIVPLSKLAPSHKAVTYIRDDRGFNVSELDTQWNVGYCVASWKYRQLAGRLFIPIYANNNLVGWQGRWVGSIPADASYIARYYTMPRMQKRYVLYNADKAFNMPVVVVCEGPSDVWSVGSCGVALMGTTASEHQKRLLIQACASKPVLVCLDADDPKAPEAANKLYKFLRMHVDNAVLIKLPADRDPGSFKRADLWTILRTQSAAAGVAIPEVI